MEEPAGAGRRPRAESLLERWVVGLIRRASPREWEDSVVGDLQEEFQKAASPFRLACRALPLASRLLAQRLIERLAGPRAVTKPVIGRGMMNWQRDLRFGFRYLRRNSGFSLLVIGILALGIGANSAIFSIIHAVLLRPLPYPNPDRLVLLYDRIPRFKNYVVQSEASFLEWKESNDVFSELTAFRAAGAVLGGEGPPVGLEGMQVTADLFSILPVSPVVGRILTAMDDVAEAPEVVLLSERLWEQRFGGDPGIVGRAVRLDGVAVTVVGVLPDSFLFPPPINLRGSVRQLQPLFFRPLRPQADNDSQRDSYVLGRLLDGVTVDQARQRLDQTARALAERRQPEAEREQFGAVILPLHEQAVSDSRTLLGLLLGSVGLILAISCVNVANLQIARSPGRRNELAIRSALGAGPGSVLRQLLAESLLLALLGGAAGIALAQVSLQGLLALGAGRIPSMGPVTLSPMVLLFTLAISIASGLAFGLFPALSLSSPDLRAMSGSAARGLSSGEPRRTMRGALVVAEIALAATLLVSAGLLVRSLNHLQQVPLGFETDAISWVPIELPAARYAAEEQILGFYRRLLTEVRSIPGVSRAALAFSMPLSPRRARSSYHVEGQNAEADQSVDFRIVSSDYFEALGIALLEGRTPRDHDDENSPLVGWINRAFRDRHFPQASPLEARFSLGTSIGPETSWFRIAGVVENSKEIGLAEEASPTVYTTLPQVPLESFNLVLRSGGGRSMLQVVRDRLWQLDPEIPIEIATLDALVYNASSSARSPTILMAILSSLAVLLAVLGLYGVLSYLVGQRTREIGIRMAVGAGGREILRLIGKEAAALVSVGLVIGGVASFGFARLFSGLLYGISPVDPLTYLAAAAGFTIVAALAAFLPARRASRVDPLSALNGG